MSTIDTTAYQGTGAYLVHGMWSGEQAGIILPEMVRVFAGGEKETSVRVLAPEHTPPDLLRVFSST